MSDRRAEQALLYRKFHTFLQEWGCEVKDMLDKDPNDPVSLLLAELNNNATNVLLRNIQITLSKADRNFLTVVSNAVDKDDVPPDV